MSIQFGRRPTPTVRRTRTKGTTPMAYESASAFFTHLDGKVQGDADAKEALKEIGATYVFEIGDNSWTYDLSDAKLSDGATDGADCTVKIEEENFLKMVNGEVQGQQLFMMGQLTIEGDMTLALRLEQVFAAAT
ncbi:MAG: alkyl sulfatase BDS1-like metallo-beta-lactamase superfamily hydrolase [Myxococcota bacterium]|jgi:alkyl sulfatase BDS1-like metallo-beta-lactamase superfamily hydrolase